MLCDFSYMTFGKRQNYRDNKNSGCQGGGVEAWEGEVQLPFEEVKLFCIIL